MISDINLDSPLGKSDHSVIMFTFNSYVSGSGAPKTRYKYDKGDYVNMSEFLKIDWDGFLGQKDIDSQWSLFREKLSEASEKYIPKIIINKDNKTKKRHNLPIKTNTKAKIKRKQRLWNKYLQTGEERYKVEYNKLRNQVRRITRQTIKIMKKILPVVLKLTQKSFVTTSNLSQRPRVQYQIYIKTRLKNK